MGIYELDKDGLKLCIPMAKPGKPFENVRPSLIDTKGKDAMLVKLKRAKPPADK